MSTKSKFSLLLSSEVICFLVLNLFFVINNRVIYSQLFSFEFSSIILFSVNFVLLVINYFAFIFLRAGYSKSQNFVLTLITIILSFELVVASGIFYFVPFSKEIGGSEHVDFIAPSLGLIFLSYFLGLYKVLTYKENLIYSHKSYKVGFYYLFSLVLLVCLIYLVDMLINNINANYYSY